jgi:hypothetical protein
LIPGDQTSVRQHRARRRQLPSEVAVVKVDGLGQLGGRVFSRASNKPRQEVAHSAVAGDIAAKDFSRNSAAVSKGNQTPLYKVLQSAENMILSLILGGATVQRWRGIY